MTVRNLQGDCRQKLRELATESVHCAVTSPPYWLHRDYSAPGQIGREADPLAYIEALVAAFAALRRVLRHDGTLWLNLGDTYAKAAVPNAALKPKDLIGLPWRVALALQADGWWLRQDIVWSKPNPTPEPVTDRCTRSHEFLFTLTKSQSAYYDAEAIKETRADDRATDGDTGVSERNRGGRKDGFTKPRGIALGHLDGKRNRRSVWEIAPQPFAEAHFATFPPALVEPCILAGTSEHGCCARCGAPWARIVDRRRERSGARTLGWKASCDCGAGRAPATVLDPFGGAGTTGLVADRLGRDAILIELNPDYAAMTERRIRGEAGLLADVRS